MCWAKALEIGGKEEEMMNSLPTFPGTAHTKATQKFSRSVLTFSGSSLSNSLGYALSLPNLHSTTAPTPHHAAPKFSYLRIPPTPHTTTTTIRPGAKTITWRMNTQPARGRQALLQYFDRTNRS